MKRLFAFLIVASSALAAIFLLGKWINTSAQAQDNPSLTATRGTPVLDGVESPGEWTSGSIITSRNVTIKAMIDDENLYLLATWPDSTESLAKDQWTFDGQNWTASGDEDRIAFVWDMKDAQGQSLNGADGPSCTTMCHPPIMRTQVGRVDTWHWKAYRFHPMGFSDDKWWDTCEDCEDGGRHGDDGAGSGSRNRNAERTGPEFMASSDPGANVDFLADDEAAFNAFDPFNVMPGSVALKVPLDPAATFSTGNTIPGRVLSIPTGNRSSVQAAGKWDNGMWTVEFRRKLAGEMGPDGQPEDFAVIPGGSVMFTTEVLDNVSDHSQHPFLNGGADFRVFTLNFPARNLYFSQFADGDGLFSQITLFTVPGTQSGGASNGMEAKAKILLKDDDGAPLTFNLNGEEVAGELDITIPASGVRTFQTDGAGPLKVGSVAVESDTPLDGVVVFGGASGLAGVGNSEALEDGFTSPMETNTATGLNTGIAVMNLENQEVTLDLQLLDADGNLLATAQSVLTAMGHEALFVTEMDWDNPVDLNEFIGLLKVTTDGRVAATVIQSRPGQLATLPVSPN